MACVLTPMLLCLYVLVSVKYDKLTLSAVTIFSTKTIMIL